MREDISDILLFLIMFEIEFKPAMDNVSFYYSQRDSWQHESFLSWTIDNRPTKSTLYIKSYGQVKCMQSTIVKKYWIHSNLPLGSWYTLHTLTQYLISYIHT